MSAKKKGKELAPVSVRAAKALAMQDREAELTTLAASTADITAITNPDGYKQVRSARLTLKNLRVEIQNAGKTAREDATAFSKAVIAEEKRLVALIQPEESRLEALEVSEDNRIAAQRQEEIDREIARQAALQERIAELRGNQLLTPTSGSALLAEHIADLEAITVDESFEEYREQAEATKAAGLLHLRELQVSALAHESEQKRLAEERAELAKLRAEQKERDRLAEIAREAEATRQREALRLQQEELDRKAREQEQAAQAERDRIAAEQKRLDDEKAELARQQEQLRVASLPPQPAMAEKPVDVPDECNFPASAVVQEGRFGTDMEAASTVPTADEIISALVDLYGESDETVLSWLRSIDWDAEMSEAA